MFNTPTGFKVLSIALKPKKTVPAFTMFILALIKGINNSYEICDQGYTPEIRDEILTTARDLELEMNEDDIEEHIMGHEDELKTEELQEILNEEHQETHPNVSPSEQEETKEDQCRHLPLKIF
ncbi:hypothetical protein TNCV_417071 [Trichonephila clavipes]|nr:hypothetical protein TNCV_417071 [Trichonephila clavipes]